ncbi:MerR family transcriptional regulator [Emticicia sp. BO119]|uniref:MerR family transcriptional regulator n=1 Tax=Emticicia sp. BO119 TaxID=2757768 RepID=UPI0015F01389|nr:MerR family transcriptional regulator [Emticicia sp. BO119]MBA4849788.1 MerR family transcriptional regulator [Emticicia sp. BO119]
MNAYSVQKMAKMAGVSVRTLHLYDQMGLLKPSIRTEARYRLYGEKELLRLQQILFYKELDFQLKEIQAILDNPDFDLVEALLSHKESLRARQDRISMLIETIDKTVNHLKTGKIMLKPEELYEGLAKETAETYRAEASKKYGEEVVEHSEKALGKLTKAQFEALKTELKENASAIFALKNGDPTSKQTQKLIAKHYEIIRIFWGTSDLSDKQAEAYKGLGQLYVNDERFTILDGQPQPEYALFLSKAMTYFADNHLK